MNMLRLVEPYIAWGHPNLKTVKELIYKRGYAKVNQHLLSTQLNKLLHWAQTLCDYSCLLSSDSISGHFCFRLLYGRVHSGVLAIQANSLAMPHLNLDIDGCCQISMERGKDETRLSGSYIMLTVLPLQYHII